jgi:hypothetical protein
VCVKKKSENKKKIIEREGDILAVTLLLEENLKNFIG